MIPPTLTLPETDGITYSVDPDRPYAPGETVEVTATLDDAGVAWPDQLPPGWTETSDTTATYTHTFDDVTCTPVLPVDPAVVEGSCANGVATPSSVQFEATPGLVYSVDPPGPTTPPPRPTWSSPPPSSTGTRGRGRTPPRPALPVGVPLTRKERHRR